ncbi:hypothetical protein C4566_00425 [Candidatus Parcubacteria bacterium]|nr:MAG: hypothetical protein C4566_00425 [Candidatus Parcubacteria bacterium]
MANYKQMDQVLDLAAKTGDKVIVVSDSHEPYVVMSIKEYEALLHNFSTVSSLTEEQLLDKINRDIAVWKASQEDLSDYSLDQFRVDTIRKDEDDNKNQEKSVSTHNVDNLDAVEEEKYYIEPID